jgi:hypothetical protein
MQVSQPMRIGGCYAVVVFCLSVVLISAVERFFASQTTFLVVCQTALSSRNAQNLSFNFFCFVHCCLVKQNSYKLTDKSLNFMSLNQCFLATFQNSTNFSGSIDSLPVATLPGS